MKLIHTLLFLFRQNRINEDLSMMALCLKSLEKSACKTVVVYNQGFLTNERLKAYLAGFPLDFHIIGGAENVGTTVGRQSCFEYIFDKFPDTEYISELHPDMIFAPEWELPLIEYLDKNDEPMVCCGIIDREGRMPFLEKSAALPEKLPDYEAFLLNLREDSVIHGFSMPCIHRAEILQKTGGYNPLFLTGKQCFEDDSLLLGYYYYYGTRAGWYPKICCRSVVYHAVAGQRMDAGGNVNENFDGLVRQYGAMGLRHLSMLHKSPWHKHYFGRQYEALAAKKAGFPTGQP